MKSAASSKQCRDEDPGAGPVGSLQSSAALATRIAVPSIAALEAKAAWIEIVATYNIDSTTVAAATRAPSASRTRRESPP